MGGLYGRYHSRLLRLATQATAGEAWKPRLREILDAFDDDCWGLSPCAARSLRHELASQIEQELLRFSDADKRAVLALALKHLDAEGA
jgi:hypothetical protein